MAEFEDEFEEEEYLDEEEVDEDDLEADGGEPAGDYRAGFVAVMGRPNVGKSSLLNALLDHPIAAVSPRPQTTRKRQAGIISLPQGQIILEDTPGVHRPLHKLGQAMNEEALEALEQADVVLFLVEANQPPQPEDADLAAQLRKLPASLPLLLVLNKVDLLDSAALAERSAEYAALLPVAGVYPVSVTSRQGLDDLLQAILAHLPENAPFYAEDMLTDLYERDIAADLIRAAALLILRDEVPHGIAVRIDEYTERGESGAYIAATLFVEREAHKGIVIGAGGSMLKQIGSAARQQIEAMSGRKVFLELRVKVRKNWRNDPAALKAFGFSAAVK